MNKLVALVPVVLAWACIGAGSEAGAATADEDAIQQVVGGYFAAFAKDSAAASDFYGEPALIVRPTQVRALSTAAEVQGFLVEELARLKPQGYAYSNIGEHHIRMLNPATALYSAVAQRMKEIGRDTSE